MNLLPFDTETTGFPDWKAPSEAEHQPHLVQLAAILTNSDRAYSEHMDVIVRPDGWTIPADTVDIHSITMERAMDEGIPEDVALDMFISMYRKADLRIAHNSTFDNRIIRIALKRHRPDLIPDEEWKDKKRYYCTLMNARKIMKGKDCHTLPEAYRHFMGCEMERQHDAMYDARACMEIYFKMTESANE